MYHAKAYTSSGITIICVWPTTHPCSSPTQISDTGKKGYDVIIVDSGVQEAICRELLDCVHDTGTGSTNCLSNGLNGYAFVRGKSVADEHHNLSL